LECGTRFEVADDLAGKVIRCRECHSFGKVPGIIIRRPAAIELLPERRYSPLLISIVIALFLLALGGATFCLLLPSPPKDSESVTAAKRDSSAAPVALSSAADRDYFAILTVSYELYAVLTFKAFMLVDAEKIACFHAVDGDRNYLAASTAATNARLLAADICEQEVQELERQKLAKKKAFLAHHHLDSKDYTATFKRSYPAHDLIFEEIAEMTKKHVRLKMTVWVPQLNAEHLRILKAASHPLTAERADAVDKQWWEFRRSLLDREVPTTIRELRWKVWALPSAKEMAIRLGEMPR
jgi:hypothetical protein